MAKQIVAPKTQLESENLIRVDQKDFGRMYADPPASEIGENVAYNENMVLHKSYAEGRTGSLLWSSTNLPYYKRWLTLSRVDDLVTLVSGTAFDIEDQEGMYIVWPDGKHDEIIEYISPSLVRTRQSGDRPNADWCWTRSRVYGTFKHAAQRKLITHIDNRLFISDFDVTYYRQIFGISIEYVARSKSYFSEQDDYVVCVNANGVFKINIVDEEPYYWKTNSAVVTERIADVIQTERLTYGRRYIVSMGRLIGGTYFGSRTGESTDTNVPLLTIEQETGTTAADETTFKDYGEVFTEVMPGKGDETYGELACDAAGTGLNTDITDWNTLDSSSFGIEINNEGVQQIFCDFSMAFTLDDIRLIIETGIRAYWPTATVTIETIAANNSRFIISSGKVDGYTISLLTAGTTGTDISNVDGVSGCGLRGTVGVGTLDNAKRYTEFSEIGTLIAPITNTTPTYTETHHTHFCVHGTFDTGPAGTDVLTGSGNNPEQYVHLDDVPIMKAFNCTEVLATHVITAQQGLFSQHDPGSTIMYQDGSVSTIQYLCNAAGVRVYTPTSQWAIGNGLLAHAASMSAVLGSQTPLTCSKLAYTVTLISGMRNFADTDIRKPIYWADGTIDYITEYVGATEVRVLESSTKASQGVAIDPTDRMYCDTTTDEVLASKIKGFTTNHRYYTPLPECELGAIVQGFLATAIRGTSTVYYSPLPVATKYLIGQYFAAENYDNRIEDDIQFILSLPDKVVIICTQSTWVAATNTPRESRRSDLGIVVPLLPLFTMIDKIGCVAVGMIREIGIGLYSIVTSEPAHRLFDGFKYGENLADDQVMDTLRKINTFAFSEYDNTSGLKLWGSKEV